MRRTSTLLFGPLLALAAGAEPTVPQDLLAVLTLKGKPCGSITSVDRKGESDYFVTCGDGHHYRVFIGPGDRVVVEDK
jgi:hypothetical protein